VNIKTSDVSEAFLSNQSHKPFESESSKNFLSRVRVRDMTGSSQSGITRTVESLQVTGLQISSQCQVTGNFTFFYNIFML